MVNAAHLTKKIIYDTFSSMEATNQGKEDHLRFRLAGYTYMYM